MREMILYHGTADHVIHPTYGLGDEKHDYGKGFYLTESIDLARNGLYADQANQMAGCISL